MGTDGVGIYENDAAGETVLRIEKLGLGAVAEHLQRVNEFGDEAVWSNVAEEALPAIDVVAHVVSGSPAEGSMIGDVIERIASSDVADLVDPAIEALNRIERPGSGLRELWIESGLLDGWLGTLADLRLRLLGQSVNSEPRREILDPVDFVPGDVLLVPLESRFGGADGLSGVVIVRSVAARRTHELLVCEIFVSDLFFETPEQPENVLSEVSSISVLEGYQVSMRPFSFASAGRLEEFDLSEWPMLLDDHSIVPTENPYLLAERHLDPSSHKPIFTRLDLPEGQSLTTVGRAYFDRPWVPFSKEAITPNSAVSKVYGRHRGEGAPFAGNGRIAISRRRRQGPRPSA